MPTTQRKEISALVAEQLGIELGACQEYCDTLHMFAIVGREATVDIHLDKGIVQICNHRDGEVQETYNIHITLTKVDGVEDTRPAWQQRVVAERDQLAERIKKLNKVISSPAFVELPPAACKRLCTQRMHMTDYLNVLNDRISTF